MRAGGMQHVALLEAEAMAVVSASDALTTLQKLADGHRPNGFGA
jgi:hypothetical protein